MLGQKLQQKLSQKISPQQIALIKLLEVPTMQLEQRIKKELEENPALENKDDINEQNEQQNEKEEDDDEFSFEDYLNDEDMPNYKMYANNYSQDDKTNDILFSSGISFNETIRTQLSLRNLNEKQKLLSDFIVGNIDESGYIRRELENIVDDIVFAKNIETTEDELLEVLKIVQDLDPAGVGARNLQECLILQLEKKEKKTEDILQATTILKKCYDEFTKKHYTKIIEKLNITEEQLKNAIKTVLKLNPKPGGSLGANNNRSYRSIIPDFILKNDNGVLSVSLNSMNAPILRVSNNYKNMLEAYSSSKKRTKQQKQAVTFVKQKLDSAKWFIDAIKQRQQTLTLTINALLEYQKKYFLSGDEADLKPMILKTIANITQLDISTISRVANSKYIQTDFGTLSLKHFFSEGMQNKEGKEISTKEIKNALILTIEKENKKRPYSDEKLVELMRQKKYIIARRTIAKYREQLKIPVARMRKELR